MSPRACRSLAGLGAAILIGAPPAPPSVARRALHPDAPPPAHTGGFGEPTCQQCHLDAGLNEPGGDLGIGGTPSAYRPGRTYRLAVTLRRAGMARAGFQLAARFAAGAAAGRQAGVLVPGDGRTAVARDSAGRVTYIQHTLAGTTITADAARWSFQWTAPAAARGPVVFHVAANAANDDRSPLGDYIYTWALEVPPARR